MKSKLRKIALAACVAGMFSAVAMPVMAADTAETTSTAVNGCKSTNGCKANSCKSKAPAKKHHAKHHHHAKKESSSSTSTSTTS